MDISNLAQGVKLPKVMIPSICDALVKSYYEEFMTARTPCWAAEAEIQWNEGDHLPRSFSWTESGGPPVTRPTHQEFGTRLIERGLAAELGAKVHMAFEPPA